MCRVQIFIWHVVRFQLTFDNFKYCKRSICACVNHQMYSIDHVSIGFIENIASFDIDLLGMIENYFYIILIIHNLILQ